MAKWDKLRLLIADVSVNGGLPATRLYDLTELFEKEYHQRFKYKIELTPRSLGAVFGEFDNIERINIKRRASGYVRIHAIETHPLISNGDNKTMVHKCRRWKRYFDGSQKYKMCEECGLILHDEEKILKNSDM
jgi:hypothetical protein